MSFGFQTFIKGTPFDVLNAMSFNYVVDVLTISGAGSKSYNLPGMALQTSLMNTFQSITTEYRSYDVSVSGTTVSWSVPNAVVLIVFAVPYPGADPYGWGFSLYDYASGQRTVRLAPVFTPYCLAQVVDVPPGAVTVQTVVPAGRGFVAFHRSTATDINVPDRAWWSQTTQGGFHALQFGANGNPVGCRVYIFSDYLVNVPEHGFFMYNGGQLVWHSNCLPLNMKMFTSPLVVSNATPLATISCVTALQWIPEDPQFPSGWCNFTCAAAGYRNGRYEANMAEVFQSTRISNPDEGRRIKPWAVGNISYIETAIYDQYFRQALGV